MNRSDLVLIRDLFIAFSPLFAAVVGVVAAVIGSIVIPLANEIEYRKHINSKENKS